MRPRGRSAPRGSTSRSRYGARSAPYRSGVPRDAPAANGHPHRVARCVHVGGGKPHGVLPCPPVRRVEVDLDDVDDGAVSSRSVPAARHASASVVLAESGAGTASHTRVLPAALDGEAGVERQDALGSIEAARHA